MSNVMTSKRLEALRRLRAAQGKDYDGCIADAYEMFLVVDECFRCSELNEVSTWLPYVPGMDLGEGEFLFAMTAKRPVGNRRIYRVWTADQAASAMTERIDWYMPLSPNKLPAMKIQEEQP